MNHFEKFVRGLDFSPRDSVAVLVLRRGRKHQLYLYAPERERMQDFVEDSAKIFAEVASQRLKTHARYDA